jgi:hypothetical protein
MDGPALAEQLAPAAVEDELVEAEKHALRRVWPAKAVNEGPIIRRPARPLRNQRNPTSSEHRAPAGPRTGE